MEKIFHFFDLDDMQLAKIYNFLLEEKISFASSDGSPSSVFNAATRIMQQEYDWEESSMSC